MVSTYRVILCAFLSGNLSWEILGWPRIRSNDLFYKLYVMFNHSMLFIFQQYGGHRLRF